MIPDFRTFIGESTWGEMRKRAEGTSKKLEDAVRLEDRVYKERFDNCVKKFVESIVYFEKFNNTLNDFLKFIDEEVSNITWYEIRSNKGKIVKFSDIVIPYVKDNWDKIDNIKKQIDDLVSDEKRELTKMGFKKEPGKTIGDMIDAWWNTLDDYTRNDLMMDSSVFKSEEEEFYSTHMDDDEFTGEDLDPDDMYVNCPMRELTQIYMDNINKVTESTWGEMRRRAEGDKIRTEDDLNSYTMMELLDYMKGKYPNVFDSTHLATLYDDEGVESIEISYYEVGGTLLPSAVVRYVNDTINSIVVKDIEKWSVYHKLMDIILPTKQFSTKTVPDTKVFKIYTKDKKAPDHNLFIKLVDCLSKNLAD